jgi:EAL domain-containing protein (putative c-di-GMP-specific phosphodiesterase class I)
MEFIRLAEETGLILALGRWVLNTACRQTREWQIKYPSDPPLKVSVNLSARQLQFPGLVDEIAEALAASQLTPASLQLEITESAAMENLDSIVALLDQLKRMGISLAIDDFGTGYSSLAYVERFPVDVLKVDKAFVDRLGQNPRDRAIVHAVAAFAKALNLIVTAEGVETAEQLAALRAIGYDQVQGYYFSKPMPGEALGELLAIRSSIARMVMSASSIA